MSSSNLYKYIIWGDHHWCGRVTGLVIVTNAPYTSDFQKENVLDFYLSDHVIDESEVNQTRFSTDEKFPAIINTLSMFFGAIAYANVYLLPIIDGYEDNDNVITTTFLEKSCRNLYDGIIRLPMKGIELFEILTCGCNMGHCYTPVGIHKTPELTNLDEILGKMFYGCVFVIRPYVTKEGQGITTSWVVQCGDDLIEESIKTGVSIDNYELIAHCYPDSVHITVDYEYLPSKICIDSYCGSEKMDVTEYDLTKKYLTVTSGR